MSRKNILGILAYVCIFGLIACGGSKEPRKYMSEQPADESMDMSNNNEATTGEAPAPTGLIKINEVTADELIAYKVSGIGPAIAQGIIDYRTEHGPFKSMADLDNVPRIGPSLMAKLEGKIDFGAAGAAAPAQEATADQTGDQTADNEEPAQSATATTPQSSAPAAKAVSSSGSAKVNVNTASAKELEQLNGVGPSTAEAIVKYRQEHGKFKTIDELDNVSRIGPATIEKFRSQVSL